MLVVDTCRPLRFIPPNTCRIWHCCRHGPEESNLIGTVPLSSAVVSLCRGSKNTSPHNLIWTTVLLTQKGKLIVRRPLAGLVASACLDEEFNHSCITFSPTACLLPAYPDALSHHKSDLPVPTLFVHPSTLDDAARRCICFLPPPTKIPSPGARIGPRWWQRSYTHQTIRKLANRETKWLQLCYPPPHRRVRPQ
ncbi:hypothetical protein BC567DRAFT_234250 [Phyllosticta citribraziliensis]